MKEKKFDIILTVSEIGIIEEIEVTDNAFIPHGTGSNHLVKDDPEKDYEELINMKVCKLIQCYLTWHKYNNQANN